jgi:hypothetical protein
MVIKRSRKWRIIKTAGTHSQFRDAFKAIYHEIRRVTILCRVVFFQMPNLIEIRFTVTNMEGVHALSTDN